jgi:hypothetical protein
MVDLTIGEALNNPERHAEIKRLELLSIEEVIDIAGELLMEIHKHTGVGELYPMIGYGQQKYGNELNFPYKKKNVYYCDYHNQLEFHDGEPCESDTDKKKIILMILDLRERFAKYKRLIAGTKATAYKEAFGG